jgi:hypothetical protein
MARLAETLAAGSEAGPSALAGTDMTQAWAAPSVRAGSAGCGALAAALAGIDMARSGSAALRGTGAAGAKALAPTAADTPAPGRACLLAAPRAWLAERGLPRPEALAALGLPPQRLLMVATRNGPEALWAAEEALRSGAVALVVVELATPPDLRQVRRLHLAAAEGVARARAAGAGRAPLGLAVMAEAVEGGIAGVESRWRLAPLPPDRDAAAPDGAAPAWRLDRLRGRDAPPAAWRVAEGTAQPLAAGAG